MQAINEYELNAIEILQNLSFDIGPFKITPYLVDHSAYDAYSLFIEMKYGDNALGSDAGMVKHLKDFEQQISGSNYKAIVETIESQFRQLVELGLIKYNQCVNGAMPELDSEKGPEVVFLLANHNPRSTKLRIELSNPIFVDFAKKFNLKFLVSSFAGYGMHEISLVSYADFMRLL